MPLTKPQFEKLRKKLRALSNSAQYKKAHLLAVKLSKKHPAEPYFAYCAAVMYGDDTKNRSKSEIAKRHRKSAELLKPWLRKLRRLEPNLRASLRNEYYWFSHQPFKQYQLGVERVAAGTKRAYYSQGVGAVELARKYFKAHRFKMGLRWSKRAERAWRNFFKEDSNWYNSYGWYAESVGFQGNLEEMEYALKKAAKISGIPLRGVEFEEVRNQVRKILALQKNNFVVPDPRRSCAR